jgi:AcrR family transcriptional regulator
VLAATNELLDEDGYDGVSYEEVARRAGVHKTTVYRRWPSKSDLVVDALDLQSEVNVPVPDTGTLTGDLRALGRAVAANITSEGGARRSWSLIATAAHSEELAATVHDFMQRRVTLTEPIVHRAIERGEAPPETDARLVIESIVGPLWFRMLLTGEPLTDDIVDALVDQTVAGLGRPA